MAEKSVKLQYYAENKSYPQKKYDELKKAVVTVIKKLTPELNRSFDLNKVKVPGGTKGLLRDYLKKKMVDEDRYAFRNIIQELIRKDKFLLHKGGRFYLRLK